MVREFIQDLGLYTVGALCAVPVGLAVNVAIASPYALTMALLDVKSGDDTFRGSFSRHLVHYFGTLDFEGRGGLEPRLEAGEDRVREV